MKPSSNIFVCQWDLSGFYTDDDGEEFNTSDLHSFTTHSSLEKAIEIAEGGYESYKSFNDIFDENKWEPLFCSSIMEYENNMLIAKYVQADSQWRLYPLMEHWKNSFSYLINYPPSLPDL